MIETDRLRPYAVSPSDSRGRRISEKESAHRSPHQRDRDRILHSTAFRRLMHKTQVFVAHEGDYYRTRLTHSLEVAQIARSAARSLRLNEDLAEAVALAHDLGHTPFGHAGEDALDEVMQAYGGFDHNAQSLRIVTYLEKRYIRFTGLNLTWETLEGLVKHNGPLLSNFATIESLPYAVREASEYTDLELSSYASLEAQIAALADDIAYNCHDLEDGFRGGFFSLYDISCLPIFGDYTIALKKEFPSADESAILNEALSSGMSYLIKNMIHQISHNIKEFDITSADCIRYADSNIAEFSGIVSQDLSIVSDFLLKNFYHSPYIIDQRTRNIDLLKDLFHHYMNSPHNMPEDWWQNYQKLNGSSVLQARIVCDYISGMTDNYLKEKYDILVR